MADYAKMKNADLEALLKERGLAHTGKKADLVKRLQDDDAEKSTAAPARKDEDEIDWDDEPVAETKPATSEPAPASAPAPAPAAAAPQTTSATTEPAAPAAENTTETKVPAEETKPAKDFTSGIAATSVDDEIAKRKARAKKFGIEESSDETLKSLERAKKFGENGSNISDKLNQALGDRKDRKRGREGGDGEDSRKRGKPGQPPRGGRNAAPRADAGRQPNKAAAPVRSGLSDADKAAAEARRAKFATAA